MKLEVLFLQRTSSFKSEAIMEKIKLGPKCRGFKKNNFQKLRSSKIFSFKFLNIQCLHVEKTLFPLL